MKKNVFVNVPVDETLDQWLRFEAARQRVTRAEVARRAFKSYRANIEQKEQKSDAKPNS